MLYSIENQQELGGHSKEPIYNFLIKKESYMLDATNMTNAENTKQEHLMELESIMNQF